MVKSRAMYNCRKSERLWGKHDPPYSIDIGTNSRGILFQCPAVRHWGFRTSKNDPSIPTTTATTTAHADGYTFQHAEHAGCSLATGRCRTYFRRRSMVNWLKTCLPVRICGMKPLPSVTAWATGLLQTAYPRAHRIPTRPTTPLLSTNGGAPQRRQARQAALCRRKRPGAARVKPKPRSPVRISC